MTIHKTRMVFLYFLPHSKFLHNKTAVGHRTQLQLGTRLVGGRALGSYLQKFSPTLFIDFLTGTITRTR